MFSKSKRNFIKIASYLSLNSFIFLNVGKNFFKKNTYLIKKKFIKNRMWILHEKD